MGCIRCHKCVPLSVSVHEERVNPPSIAGRPIEGDVDVGKLVHLVKHDCEYSHFTGSRSDLVRNPHLVVVCVEVDGKSIRAAGIIGGVGLNAEQN
ncbi:hypothetical protein DIPPA_03712 [Diplonema papillatum]|nr:hypothetical protein DIPPA_03712 [Diplonema papillatum]